MKKIILILAVCFVSLVASGSLYAQEPNPSTNIVPVPVAAPKPVAVADANDDSDDLQDSQDKDDEKKAIDKVNEVIQKIFDRAMAAKPKYKELADFDEKCLTKDENGFLKIKYESQTTSVRGEVFPYVFRLAVEPLWPDNAPKKTLQQGEFVYTLPFLDLQFSGYVVKHPIRRQYDFNATFETAAEELVDYQQQFLPLRFMIVPESKTFKTNQTIRFKVVLLNTSQHNILVKSLGKDTLFFTLNNAVWGAEAGDADVLSPREQRREASRKRAEMRALLRQKKRDQALQTVVGQRTHVGDQTILREGEALVIDFSGEGYRRAQDVDLRGIYQMNVKGLRPTAKVILKIVKDEPSS